MARTAVHRLLPTQPVTTVEEYRSTGGGRGLEAARRLGPAAVIDEVEASGLRGRGGAGFPTGVKWRTVAEYSSESIPATVVVNAAEGEPGSFKDRALVRANPFAVVEGAIIASEAVGADRAVIAVKETFTRERGLLESAVSAAQAAGWADRVTVAVVTGPSEYLFGEETALLEVLDGRPPFPRIAPPFRHGVDDVGTIPSEPAGTFMADPAPGGAAPTLANNVETIANVAGILADGPDAFRAVGTAESPGTIVCTVTGDVERHGVAEVPMGTTLQEAIDLIGGGARRGRRLVAAMSGVANALVPVADFDTPLTYEDMARIGSGLGAAGFLVFDSETDLLAVAAGVSRFLAVESCGQCTPCKRDGLAIADLLRRGCASSLNEFDAASIADLVETVADEARCFLAHQHRTVVGSLLQRFPDALTRHLDPATPPVAPVPILPIVDIVDGKAELDSRQGEKHSDWSFDALDSGLAPVERLAQGAPPRADS